MKTRSIAIDGPSGAGKSTLARKIAASYGYVYVDTGAIYRCVGLYALSRGVEARDNGAVTSLLREIDIAICYDETGLQRMLLNGKDVTDEIRRPEVSAAASDVSANPEVRRFLLDMQRELARKHDVVMDGRDIGTVVLPEADLKIFLTATTEDRAQRRYLELQQRGHMVSYDEVLRDMEVRDKNDSTRSVAPLKPAADAVILDTTGNSYEKSYQIIRSLVEERLCR